MEFSKTYGNAPITEALIDLRVGLLAQNSLASFAEIQKAVIGEYPIREDMQKVEQHLEVGPSIKTTTTQTPVGYRFLSEDKKRIFQAKSNGFTFNWLAPYENWATFSTEAKRLWDIYKSFIPEAQIIRVAVRYINRLDLPLPLGDFKEYLRTVPEVSPSLPQGLSDFFMQLQIPQEDLDAMLLLNEAMVPSSKENHISVVLDIDLFRDALLDKDSDEHWDMLEKLRARKNQIFEACITDKTRSLIN